MVAVSQVHVAKGIGYVLRAHVAMADRRSVGSNPERRLHTRRFWHQAQSDDWEQNADWFSSSAAMMFAEFRDGRPKVPLSLSASTDLLEPKNE